MPYDEPHQPSSVSARLVLGRTVFIFSVQAWPEGPAQEVFVTILRKLFSLAIFLGAFSLGAASTVDAMECKSLFESDRVETDARTGVSEAIAYLGKIPGSIEFLVTWISPKPFSFQDYRQLDTNAVRLGITIVTELEHHDIVPEKSPMGVGFLNTFIVRGESSKISALLAAVNVTDARIADFEALNRKFVKLSTGFAALHIGSSLERRRLIEKFIAESQDPILVINDLDSRTFFSMIDARLYSTFFSPPEKQNGFSFDRIFVNWNSILQSLRAHQGTYVHRLDGRDFVITSLDEMLKLQSRISNQNQRREKAGLISTASRESLVETAAVEAKAPETKAAVEAVLPPEVNKSPVAGISAPFPTVEPPWVIKLGDFISQNESAVKGLRKSPARGGHEFMVLKLDDMKRFYVVNPFWIGHNKARDILKELETKNPSYPRVAHAARSSLRALDNGRTLDEKAYGERSIRELTGRSAGELLAADYARGLTVVVTEREETLPTELAKTHLRYVLIPIPSFAPELANSASQNLPPSVPAAATAGQTSVPTGKSKRGPVIKYSQFRIGRAAQIGPDGRHPLAVEKVVALEVRGRIKFFILDPGFVKAASLEEIGSTIESRYPEQPTLLKGHREFLAAMKMDSMEKVPHVTHFLSGMTQSNVSGRLQSAYDSALPIVVTKKAANSEIQMILIPSRESPESLSGPDSPDSQRGPEAQPPTSRPRMAALKKSDAPEAATEPEPFAEGIGVGEFMLHRVKAIGPGGRKPLNGRTPVRVLTKFQIPYFYIVSVQYLRTADSDAVADLIRRRFPKLPPLSREDLKFVSAMKKESLGSVPHVVHSLGELSGQGASTLLEAARIANTPILAKRTYTGENEWEFVLIPVHL